MPDAGPTPRDRVLTALAHRQPDRAPVDFLATPEIWRRLLGAEGEEPALPATEQYFDPAWEGLLARFAVDCRVLSYDQFFNPPGRALHPGGRVDWWGSLGRSTPNRMWRQVLPDGTIQDLWGHTTRIVPNPTGAYEEYAGWPLREAANIAELQAYPWPEPDWWDFSPLPAVIRQLDPERRYHLRFRMGSVFETAWQLRGLERFLIDLATQPALPLYIMDRITDVIVENTRRVLALAGGQIDMLYFYDDVATQNSLLISKAMWRNFVRLHHARLIEAAGGLPVMYHCDGALAPLIPELIDLGIAVLNPIQADVRGMAPERLKAGFGDRLSFHGGIDIVGTLRQGPPDAVRAEAAERVRVLGRDGGYILCSSHHIQPDTPRANIAALYDLANRAADQGR